MLSSQYKVFRVAHLRRAILVRRDKWTPKKAATLGRLDAFTEDVVEGEYKWTNWDMTHTAMDFAAGNDHLDVVQWLHLHRPDEGCTIDAMDYAAGNGHLDVVKWLHLNREEGCTTNAMNWAAMNGHFEIVKWLHLNRNNEFIK